MNKLILNVCITLCFLCGTLLASELNSSLDQRPGYFKSMWKIASFYFENRWKQHYIEEKTPNLNSHFQFLSEKRSQNNMGKMTSFFDDELQTRIYYSATGKPDLNGVIPVVDPKSKGLVIYFHGSGTEKGSGANFNYKGNRLSVLGYSSMAMDYPFHQDGPINSKFGRTANYMKYILRMIEKYRIAGQPVTLVGHSFGVNVIAEFITRYPFAVDAAVFLSPGGFNQELRNWAENKTKLMLKTFPHFIFNEMGSRWASFISYGFVWAKTKNRKFADPTIVNPKLKVRIVSGEWEEFIPGPLDENGLPKKVPRSYDVLGAMRTFFSKAVTTLEPGVGHLVHSHTDAKGNDLVLREILSANGENIELAKEISDSVNRERKNTLTELDLGIQKAKTEFFFKKWLSGTYGSNYINDLLKSDNEVEAIKLMRKVLHDFKKFEDWRIEIILPDLKEKKHPFYKENAEKIEMVLVRKDLNVRTNLINQYYAYLEANPEAQNKDGISHDLVEQWKRDTSWSFEERTRVQFVEPSKHKKSNGNPRDMCIRFYKTAS